MKHFLRTITCCFLVLIIGSCTNENIKVSNVPEPVAYKEMLNVSYGSNSQQVYDIYLPEARDINTKVMILVHGGGWTSGDKTDLNFLKDLYRTNLPNLAIVNINYRLSDENNPPYPMQIDDISAIVDQLKSKKEDYVISDTYGFLGISAGAHLSLLWSYAFDTQKNVNMVASIVGPTNFTDPAYLNNTDPELQLLLNVYGINPIIDFLEEISPLHRVQSDAPPTILFYGGQDPLVPTTQGTDLRDKLNILGVTNEFTLYPNAGHGWVGADLLDTWSKLKVFTETYL